MSIAEPYDKNKHKVLSRQEARDFDRWAIDEFGIPSLILMENAALGCVEVIETLYPDTKQVVVLAGTGNNAGDGFAIARHLLNRGLACKTVVMGNTEKFTADAGINYRLLEKMTADIHTLNIEAITPESLQESMADAGLIVDAVFGTGLRGDLRQPWPQIFDIINGMGKPTLAVDIPSGLDCDTGVGLGNVIRAAVTVSFIGCKKGFLVPEAGKYTGRVYVGSIGITPKHSRTLQL